MLENAKSLGILDSFNTELLSAVHKVGIVLSKMQKSCCRLLQGRQGCKREERLLQVKGQKDSKQGVRWLA